jgi:hypothetical protein
MGIHSDVDNTSVLYFDTGLNERAFAQAGLSKLITQEGVIVKNNGIVEKWKIDGSAEKNGNMFLWGRNFTGRTLDVIIAGEANEALSAVRFWLKAQPQLKLSAPHLKNSVSIAPCGVVCSNEALLFLPEQLVARYIEAQQKTTEKIIRYVHPDLSGENAAVWSLACLLYRVFCKKDPFFSTDQDVLRQDIREAVFLPTRFACPGLDNRLDSLLQQTFSYPKKTLPSLKDFSFLITENDANEFKDPPAFLTTDDFIHIPSHEKLRTISAQSAKFIRKQQRITKLRRSLKKNKTLLFSVTAAILVVAIVVVSLIKDRANLPNTRGLSPIAVVETYYSAMGNLDHLVMSGCVLKKAGKDDIDMATELFVLGKVRQAYEVGKPPSIISAETWLQNGAQPTPAIVFGPSHLQVLPLDADSSDGEVSFKAQYKLWAPAFSPSPDDQTLDDSPSAPGEQSRIDEITLVLLKDQWRISQIKRSVNNLSYNP